MDAGTATQTIALQPQVNFHRAKLTVYIYRCGDMMTDAFHTRKPLFIRQQFAVPSHQHQVPWPEVE